MLLGKKTLEKLRIIINGDGKGKDYRSGPQLVEFFNDLGFNDVYGQGFPSRWYYTDICLEKINGTPELDKCIKNTFAVINYIGRIAELDTLIADFNQYLAFDKWAIIRDNNEIKFKKLDRVIIDEPVAVDSKLESDEEKFLKLTFDVDVDSLGLDINVGEIIKKRLDEAEICINNNAPLAAIFLIGSMLEGILLGIASSYPKLFNEARLAPKSKDNGKVKEFHNWTLNDFIDVSCELGIIQLDVKKHAHAVREFRNYIHPYRQMLEKFNPTKQSALISFQVLKAAIFEIGEYRKNGGQQ